MKALSLLSPKDIYIEINGVKLAAIKSYKVNIIKELYNIDCYDQPYPIKILPGKVSYNIDLSNVCLLDNLASNPIDYFNLSNFNLTIVKPKSNLIFSGCNWSSFSENIIIDSPIIQSLSLSASKRINY